MRKNVTLLAVICALLAGSAYADQPITIRGLNLDSKVEDLLDTFQECTKTPAKNPESYVCGIDWEKATLDAAFDIDENGNVILLVLSCKFTNGCKYSEEELAIELSQDLDLPEPQQIKWEGVNVFAIDGPSGDRLILSDSPSGPFINLEENNYRKPNLILK